MVFPNFSLRGTVRWHIQQAINAFPKLNNRKKQNLAEFLAFCTREHYLGTYSDIKQGVW